MDRKFYSNGKLLLSGEYAVLDGAQAWAIPTKYGQYLSVSTTDSQKISWKSVDEKGRVWFEGSYQTESLKEVSTSDSATSKALIEILSEARKMNPDFLKDATGYDIETVLTFPKDWGLGSSSTLLNNIAQWASINAFELLSKTFGGSGYDIACAQHNTPILFQINKGIAEIQEIYSNPKFTAALYFVYLNKKKNSRDAIEVYRKRAIEPALIETITQLTKRMHTSNTIEDFEELMTRHEKELSDALGIPTVKAELFSGYTGAIKSLGAWGGDFILVTGDEHTPAYFKGKGYATVIAFDDMIL